MGAFVYLVRSASTAFLTLVGRVAAADLYASDHLAQRDIEEWDALEPPQSTGMQLRCQRRGPRVHCCGMRDEIRHNIAFFPSIWVNSDGALW